MGVVNQRIVRNYFNNPAMTTFLMCKNDPKRRAIIISTNGATSLFVDFSPDCSQTIWLLTTNNPNTIILRYCDIGDLITQELYCYTSGNLTDNVVVEVLLE